jgi:hypothetical protein
MIRNGSYMLLAACWCAVAACGGDSALATCDIREPSCQFDVFLAVQDVRGSIWDAWIEPPPMDVICEAAYRAQVAAERERAVQEKGVDYFSEGLKLLRMIDPAETPDEEVSSEVDSVAAFYDAQTHRVTILDRAEIDNPAQAVRTLAHELVHAAQDRDVGFRRLYDNAVSTDNVQALSALIEGEAEMYAILVDAKQLDIPKTAIDWRILENWLLGVRMKTFDDPSPYRIASVQLPYPIGGMYAANAYVAGGPLDVRRSYDAPPLSAARLIAGRNTPGDVEAPAWRCALTAPPSGYELVVADELGALALYSFATRFALAESQAWERARTWTGDRFQVFRRPDDANALAVAWLLRFADTQAAAAVHMLLTGVGLPDQLQTFLNADTVHVFASKSPIGEPYDDWMRCASF